MLTGIHFLLTYTCIYECDHCFVFSSPSAEGTFTLDQIKTVLDEADKIGTVKEIYFEGGEPFMFYPLMVEGVKLAKERGYKVGLVTNAYWAISEVDAVLWLKPLIEAGLSQISVSDDKFHGNEDEDRAPLRAVAAARRLGLDTGAICIEDPVIKTGDPDERAKGEKVIEGGAMLKGRAAEKLSGDLPHTDWKRFNSCPYEDFENPQRVHIDAFGHAHICQGISMGNMWETPLSQLVKEYSHTSHPISKMLIEGGPAALAHKFKFGNKEKFVDACHLCYYVRRYVIDKYPGFLAPRQVYGLE